MLRHMRTTVRLNAQLLAEVKKYAADTGRTFAAVLEDALRDTLSRRLIRPKRNAIRLRTFKGGGVRSGVDLDDSAALLEAMES